MSTPDYKDEIPEGEDAAETPETRTVTDDDQRLLDALEALKELMNSRIM